MAIPQKTDELLEELSFFADWQERYEYVISMGKKLAPMDNTLKTPERTIKGCQSQVWLESQYTNGIMHYKADSDSLITKGMIALFVRILDQETPDNILSADMSFIEETGLKEHLAPTRANALTLMANEMKKHALEAANT